MKTVYFVLMESTTGYAAWDTYCGAYATHAEALAAAEREWRYLTAREKRARVVSVNHADVADDVPLDEAHSVICVRGDGWYEDEVFKHE